MFLFCEFYFIHWNISKITRLLINQTFSFLDFHNGYRIIVMSLLAIIDINKNVIISFSFHNHYLIAIVLLFPRRLLSSVIGNVKDQPHILLKRSMMIIVQRMISFSHVQLCEKSNLMWWINLDKCKYIITFFHKMITACGIL